MPAAKSAVVKLQNSRLLTQDQLLLNDVEMKSLNLALKGKASTSVVEAITDAQVTRTIEGASTVEITLLDRDREILRSGRLTKATDIKIDGLWFRLRSVQKQGDSLTLMFEDREVAILRTYNKHMVAARGSLSRTRFIKRMVDEVKEMTIPFVCPEMDMLPPIRTIVNSEAFYQPKGTQEWEKAPGFGDTSNNFNGPITVRGIPADIVQMSNTDKVLQVGVSRGASYSVLLSAIEVINEESNARNLNYSGDGLSVGLFQQRFHQPGQRYWGTKEELMDIAHASNLYYNAAIQAYLEDPSRSPEVIAQHAQSVMYMDHIVALWRTFREEAIRTLQRWGVPKDAKMASQGKVTGQSAKSTIEQRRAEEAAKGSDVSPKDKSSAAAAQTTGTSAKPGSMVAEGSSLELESENYQFHRGTFTMLDGQKVPQPENSWECAGRLAEEINWRRFIVSGTFYLISEPYLFRSAPQLKVTEDTPGVIAIDGDYTVGQKNATVTITARVQRWRVPPGAMVEVFELGPLSGRWLVSEISRDLFDTKMEIKLKKPRPILKEPNLDQEKGLTFSLPGQEITGGGYGEVDTTTVPVVPAESLTAVRNLINAGKITFDHANDRQGLMLSGSILRKDGSLVPVSGAILSFLVWAARQWKIGVSSLVGSHDQYVAGSDNTRQSRHWTGYGMDINYVDGNRVQVPSSRTAIMAFMKTVGMLGPGFIPDQMICNGCGQEDATIQALQLNNGLPKSGHWVGDHIDHVHIGF